MYKVSVIIPNYNHCIYLVQRIESVLNQTFQDFEVIILDDCSTDKSRDIIEKYRSHPKVTQIVYNSFNSGTTFKQWQKGLVLARGEWIWIAESDDWCEPTFLQEVLMPVNDIDNGVVISYCQSIIFNDNKIISYPNLNLMNEEINGVDFIQKKMNLSNSIYNASMCVFKKDIAHSLSEVVHFKFCGDWFFWILLALKGKVHISGKCLNYYRKHAGDVTSKRYIDGTFYKEYLEIQDYLSLTQINSKKVYNYNLVYHYQNIKKVVSNSEIEKSVKKLYKNSLASDLNILLFKSYVYKKVNSIKNIFS